MRHRPTVTRGDWQQPATPRSRASWQVDPLLVVGVLLSLTGLWFMFGYGRGVAPLNIGQIPTLDRGHGTSYGAGGLPPRTLTLPSLKVKADVLPVGRTRHGDIAVPTTFTNVGWWKEGAGSGPNAPMVFVGHLDDHGGPARLLRPVPASSRRFSGGSHRRR